MFAIWADGTRCYLEDLEEYLTFMSDDYEIGWEDDMEAEGE